MTPHNPHPIILDTSIIIDLLHNKPQAIDLFTRISSAHHIPGVSVITQIELQVGAKDERHQNALKTIFSQVSCHALTSEIANQVAPLLAQFGNDRQQRAALLPDAIIAATAEHLHANIYTANFKHFNLFALKNSKVIGYD